jgi:hypothetical protein
LWAWTRHQSLQWWALPRVKIEQGTERQNRVAADANESVANEQTKKRRRRQYGSGVMTIAMSCYVKLFLMSDDVI